MDAAQDVAADLSVRRVGDGDVLADQQDGAVRVGRRFAAAGAAEARAPGRPRPTAPAPTVVKNLRRLGLM